MFSEVKDGISVIVVSSHTGAALERTIDSVLAQGEGVELVLVDNGNPPDVESRLIERFKDVVDVRVMTGHGDVGLVRGLNLGARVARGKYLLFLDETCCLEKGVCAFLRKTAAQRTRPFFMTGRIVDAKGVEKPFLRCSFLTPKIGFVHAFGLSGVFPHMVLDLGKQPLLKKMMDIPAFGCAACVFLAKETLFDHGGLDERFFPSLAVMSFCCRVHRAKGDILFAPHVLARSEGMQKRVVSKNEEKQRLVALMRYYFENFEDSYPHLVLLGLNFVDALRAFVGALLGVKTTVL